MKNKLIILVTMTLLILGQSSVFAYNDAKPLLKDKDNYNELMNYVATLDFEGLMKSLSGHEDDESVKEVLAAYDEYGPYDLLETGMDPLYGSEYIRAKGFSEITDTVHIYAVHDRTYDKIQLTVGSINKELLNVNQIFVKADSDALYNGIVLEGYGFETSFTEDGRYIESRPEYLYTSTIDYLYNLELPASIRFMNQLTQEMKEIPITEAELNALKQVLSYTKFFNEMSAIHVVYDLQAKAAEPTSEPVPLY